MTWDELELPSLSKEFDVDATELVFTSSTVVNIIDDGRGIEFLQTNYGLSENSGTYPITVWRGTQTNGTTTVKLLVNSTDANTTATEGVDFTVSPSSLVFDPDETQKNITVTLLNDGLVEGQEFFTLDLVNPVGGSLGNARRTTVYIDGNDFGYSIAGFIDSPDGEFRITEREGDVQILVRRDGGFDFASTVEYSVEPLDPASLSPRATPGGDFELAKGTLNFAPGQSSTNITVRLHADTVIEDDECFRVRLLNPSAGVRINNGGAQFSILERQRHPVRVDPDFHPAIAADGNAHYWTGHLAPLPDGRVFVLTALNRFTGEDGSIDLSFISNVENSIWLSPYDVEFFENQGYRDQLFFRLRRE